MERTAEILIVSPKQEGNTHRVGAHMALESGADLLILEKGKTPDLKQYGHIVLCSGVYGDRIHAALAAWLKNLEKEQLREDVKFHVFLTWFGRGASDKHAAAEARNLLAEKGLFCKESYGSCFGGKFFLRKGHPDEDDFRRAVLWMNGSTSENV